MPFPGLHKYLAISGGLPGGESWSFGFRMTTDSFDGPQVEEEEVCAALATRISAWWTGQGNVGGNCTLTTVKWNTIRADGRYAEDYTVRRDFTTPVPSGAAASPYPNQVAVVATLETGLTRGLAHRGRVFLPRPVQAVGTDGRWPEATAVSTAGRMKELIDSINANPISGRVIVGSNTREGAFREVTAVSVGRVLDTMRSRRTSLDEGRMSAAIAAGT